MELLKLDFVEWIPSEEFKAEHPELDWRDDGANRVYGVTNPNIFDIAVEWSTGYEEGVLIAKAEQQSLFLRQWDDGRMKIKWHHEVFQ